MQSSGSHEKYRGVKGWLLLLCISMTILTPVSGFVGVMAVGDTLKPYFAQDSALFRLVFIEGVCNICLLVYSMYAGVSLWKVAPNAVVTAKRYFVILFLYSFFSIFFPQLVGLSEKTRSEIYKDNPILNVVVMVEVCVWYLYLHKSKRVRATYGENRSVSHNSNA